MVTSLQRSPGLNQTQTKIRGFHAHLMSVSRNMSTFYPSSLDKLLNDPSNPYWMEKWGDTYKAAGMLGRKVPAAIQPFIHNNLEGGSGQVKCESGIPEVNRPCIFVKYYNFWKTMTSVSATRNKRQCVVPTYGEVYAHFSTEAARQGLMRVNML